MASLESALPSALQSALPSSLLSLGSNADVSTLFSLDTFLPQPFWLLIILAPNWDVTKKVMGSWAPILTFALIHLAVVVISATQEDGTAPIVEFAKVFDASGFPFSDEPQKAMSRMMTFPNFVAEEWPHVLIWDLFVGRYIWLDGLKRGVFTPHSVLLTNFIGPPGLLLHFLTCAVTSKGLPDDARNLDEAD
ncbi:hypothetical protein M885DRAFT_454213 [Pelagophyceae sp. CCMP2097]|nr:hypothetical protein M885DRAFT_454213 [Pelagophyceae sp. CCMP2097]